MFYILENSENIPTSFTIEWQQSEANKGESNQMSETSSNRLLSRIRRPDLHRKVMSAEQTIPFFKDGMYLGFSGFAEGHPKTVPAALADHVEKNHLMGENVFPCVYRRLHRDGR